VEDAHLAAVIGSAADAVAGGGEEFAIAGMPVTQGEK